MKPSTYTKLKAYSTLAASVLLAAKASGQIVYTNPKDRIISTPNSVNSIKIDINDDRIAEFWMSAIFYPPTNSNHIGVQFDLADGNLLVAFGCTSSEFQPLALKAGYDIGSFDNWLLLSPLKMTFILNYQICGYSSFSSCSMTTWAGKRSHYLGVRFFIKGNTYYGWVRLTVKPYCEGMRIYDWAYNAIKGAPILAGQITSIDSKDGPKSIFVDDLKEESPDANELKIYSFNKIIMIQDNYRNDPLEVSIYNQIGQLIREVKTTDASVAIELQNATAGTYIVNVNGNQTSFSKQIVIQ